MTEQQTSTNEGHHASKSLSVRIVEHLSNATFINKFKRTTLSSRTSKPSQSSVKSQDPYAIPLPADFLRYVPWICSHFNVSATVVRVFHGGYLSGNAHIVENQMSFPMVELDDSLETDMATEDRDLPRLDLRVIAHYNRRFRLTEIVLDKNENLPVFLIGIISNVLQHHVQCNKVTINKGLSSHGVKEIKDMLDVVNVKELCFDGMPLPNYHILLDKMTLLQHLSLARCNINDSYVKIIADKLTYPNAASKSLCILNLSSNRITDVGLKYLADSLRSNRQLYYINLSNNDITDEGVGEILRVLLEFPLTPKEAETVRMRACATKGGNAKQSNPKVESPKAKNLKRRTVKPLKKKTTIAPQSEQNPGPRSPDYPGPFDASNTVVKDNCVYSIGNNSLCFINIAYNKLTYLTVKKVLEVLKYQASWTQGGLKMVNMEGSRFMRQCPELEEINTILMNNLSKVRMKSKTKLRVS